MKKQHSAEQIVGKLRQADVELGKGVRVSDVCRQLGISEQTYYRWRQKYGGMAPDMAKQFKAMEKELRGSIKQRFSPEFLNRIDEIIVFKPLLEAQIKKIIELQLDEMNTRLSAREVSVEVSPAAKGYLVQVGYDRALGVRNLKRELKRHVEDPIAEQLLQDKLKPGQLMVVDFKESTKKGRSGSLVFSRK